MHKHFSDTKNENRTFSDLLTYRVDFLLELFRETMCLSFAVIYCCRKNASPVKNYTRRGKKILPIDINCKITLTLTSVCVVKYLGEQTGLKIHYIRKQGS